MKKILYLVFTILSLSATAQNVETDMGKYLDRTDELIKQGKYEEALERCIWFHNNALEYDKGMIGVRSSFALSDWKNLGKIYPPAMKALVNIRDAKTQKLTEGNSNKSLFSDVMAINRTLEENTKTVLLFDLINKQNHEFAKTCWQYAKEDIFSAKRFDLIKLFAESPMAEYTLLHNNMLRLIEAGAKTRDGDSLKKYAEDVFVEKCILLIDYVLFEKDIETAKQIKEAALKVVNDNRLNNVVTS